MKHEVKIDPRGPASPLACAVDSVALARLIEEVRNEDVSIARSYDRTHNRHNR
jgi:hypothetical protein